MFYDMAKFQYFYNEGKADVGVEIVPSHCLQKTNVHWSFLRRTVDF